MVANSYMWSLSTSFSTHNFIFLFVLSSSGTGQLSDLEIGSSTPWLPNVVFFGWNVSSIDFPIFILLVSSSSRYLWPNGSPNRTSLLSHSIYYTLISMCLIVRKGRYASFAWCVSSRLQKACNVIATSKCIWYVLTVWNCYHLPQVSL